MMKNKAALTSLIFLLIALCSSAQSISSLTPSSGPVGTQVTIYGSGFAASGNIVHFRNGTTDMIYESWITASSSDGTHLSFAVPSSVNLLCVYQTPPCASPGLMVSEGTYLVFVELSGTNSNGLSFYVTGSPTPDPSAVPTMSPPPPANYLSIQSSITSSNISVTVNPPGTTAQYPISCTYISPTTVTVTANNYINMSGVSIVFTGWSGDLTGSSNPVTLTVDGVKSITANYTYQSDIPTVAPTPASTPVIICAYTTGDANGNGTIDIIDALVIARYYIGLSPVIDICAADVNHDGTVDIIDALLVAQCYVGLRLCNF
jgi:hypothetical protein